LKTDPIFSIKLPSGVNVLSHFSHNSRIHANQRSGGTFPYKRGLSSYLEVLTNQTVALTDERALAAISTRRVVSSVQLVMALGGGWDTAQLPKD
jgi:hypothetical protein